MKVFVRIVKWPKVLVDLGYSIDAARILLEQELAGVLISKYQDRTNFLFESRSEKEVATLMQAWSEAALNPQIPIEDCCADLMVLGVREDLPAEPSFNIFLGNILPLRVPGDQVLPYYLNSMKTQAITGQGCNTIAAEIMRNQLENSEQVTYLKEFYLDEQPVLLPTKASGKVNSNTKSTRKSRTFSVKIVDFAKDDLSKRLSQAAVLEWIAQVNQPGRHVSVYNRQLVKRRLRKESSLKGWLQRTKEEFIGWVAGYSVQYDDNGLIQKVVARVQIHRKHWERLGISGKNDLRAKVINLTTGKILKHIGPIDLVVRKPAQPKVKVDLTDLSAVEVGQFVDGIVSDLVDDKRPHFDALKELAQSMESNYVINPDSVTGHSGISPKD